MTTYSEEYPTSQDDLLEKTIKRFSGCSFHDLKPLTLFESGMGSGKSNIMTCIPNILREFNGILFVLEKDNSLKSQIITPFLESRYSSRMVLLEEDQGKIHTVLHMGAFEKRMMVRQGGYSHTYAIQNALNKGKLPVVFLKNIAHKSGRMNGSATILETILRLFPSVNKIAFVDEIDNQLTAITGGINAKVDHSQGIMKDYNNVISQKESLNTFDILRNFNVKCIGFSGTMNNMICSKLPSLGYNKDDIEIINVFPIESLYKDLTIVPIDVSDFNAIAPYVEAAENMEKKKTLVVCPSEHSITDFKRKYSIQFGREIDSVKITGENTAERETVEWKSRLASANYVFGINKVITGFDLSTWVKEHQFSLGILYRKLSDKAGQPLSKNEEHDLYMDTAASLMQLLARLRKGGIFLVPLLIDNRPLYNRLVEVFEHIRDGVHEYDWVGGIAGSTQIERVHKSLVLSLVQNLKEDDRPVVSGILHDLKEMTGRDFKEEMIVSMSSPSSFDHPFWTEAIGYLWKIYLVEHDMSLGKGEKETKKQEIMWNYKNRIETIGGGLRKERTQNEEDIRQIIERSKNTCGHCGEIFEDIDSPQNCHIKRDDEGGTTTLDNIIRGHSDCDKGYDEHSNILYDINRKGVWLRKRVTHNNPHREQLDCISLENLKARWAWERDRQGKSHLDDEGFRKYLTERGYIYKEY